MFGKPSTTELMTAIHDLGSRMDDLGARLDARLDSLSGRIDTLIDSIADVRVELAQHRHEG